MAVHPKYSAFMAKIANTDNPLVLGVDGGATGTVAILADSDGNRLDQVETAPANLRLLGGEGLARLLRSIAVRWPKPRAICVGLAGLRNARDQARVVTAAGLVWKGVPCRACSDLDTALAAVDTQPSEVPSPRVLILSGTGSCCYGKAPDGRTAKIGGWGHLLGDKGSGYDISLRAMKAVVYYFDRDGIWPRLGSSILRALQLNEADDLIGWVQQAEKGEVAALAPVVFAAWRRRDKIARDILDAAAEGLAKDAAACANRIARADQTVQFVLSGGVLLQQPRFARLLEARVTQLWQRAQVLKLERESAWGAVHLARLDLAAVRSQKPNLALDRTRPVPSKETVRRESGHSEVVVPQIPSLTADLSPTERRNPRSRCLDTMPLGAAIKLMLDEEGQVPSLLLAQERQIERAIRLIERSMRRRGRLFYVGAGTSGRLGALDASECPPTFRADPEQVQGIIAGGQRALWQSMEGVEDDWCAGARALEYRGVSSRDVVVGIAASGRTPFVWGALGRAKALGAKAILLSFNPCLNIPLPLKPDIVIAVDLGPEVLTGSTRLKAGTATKLVLNMLTTLTMVRLGKVKSNLMIDLNPANEKLRERAVRIVRELTGRDQEDVTKALHQAGWVVKRALRRLVQARK